MISNAILRLLWRQWNHHPKKTVINLTYNVHGQFYGTFSAYPKTHEAKAVSEAEKIVGYPTSFLSFRHLLTDEVSNVAVHMKKLLGSRHPLMHTIRGLINNSYNENKAKYSLIVLLIAKAAGKSQMIEEQSVDGIYPTQRSLAEITEIIRMAQIIHTGVVNLPEPIASEEDKELQLGNKMAVLIGDFLLAKASNGLAKLENTQVVQLMSEAISEMMEGEFLCSTIQDVIKSDIMDYVNLWEQRTLLRKGSLLSKSCQCALKLVNHSEEAQMVANNFGQNLAYTQQLSLELSALQLDDTGSQIDYTSLPALLALQNSEDKATLFSSNIQFYKHQKLVLDEVKTVYETYKSKLLDSLAYFQDCDAKTALEKIVITNMNGLKIFHL
ncbi:Decaprenyl-diphosphate synthase subunit 2 [Trichoplax sp. H2]|nr:Decaprenyl-diphosphate synthase subunit 2 [Trichoplax sp. H2]|eukprot:RDD45898.1 Decaprenyl-diphosphate synthase subunit 2 [Trichoplax sp. H2]